MNLIIEIIDGVAYAVARANEPYKACIMCAVRRAIKCQLSRMCKQHPRNYYRRLTAEEREEVTKAMGRGME